MNDWWFLAPFILLAFIAISTALYPWLKKKKPAVLLMFPIFVLFVLLSYWQWGAWSKWMDFREQQFKQEKVQRLLASMKSPHELIEKIKLQLRDEPNSVRGWYLLGRLYANQNDWKQALKAFKKAHHLDRVDEKISVNYAQSLWYVNQQRFNTNIRNEFKRILQRNPRQPDALAMLAIDAYMNHNYDLAIQYWKRLQALVPEGSDDAKAIRQAIAKAEENRFAH